MLTASRSRSGSRSLAAGTAVTMNIGVSSRPDEALGLLAQAAKSATRSLHAVVSVWRLEAVRHRRHQPQGRPVVGQDRRAEALDPAPARLVGEQHAELLADPLACIGSATVTATSAVSGSSFSRT